MAPVIRIDDEILAELKKRAIELNLVFSSPNEVLKTLLLSPKDETPDEGEPTWESVAFASAYPSSKNPDLQRLLDGLKSTIFQHSLRGMLYFSNANRWVAAPNAVAISVQDARAQSIAITVYGNPDDFSFLGDKLMMKPDRASYSRFTINSEDQIEAARQAIVYAFHMKG